MTTTARPTNRGPQRPAAATPSALSRMTIGAVQRSRRTTPDRILLMGTEGVGKTTFAADAPSPIFIAAEDGVHHVDVDVFPEPKTWSEVLDAVRTLQREPHDYKTVVFDTVDWIEPLVWAEVCQRNRWLDDEGNPDIEKPGYGKGYVPCTAEWRRLLLELDRLRIERGMEVILLAHASLKMVPNPLGLDYSRYECKLQKSAAALLREWVDAALFAVKEEFVHKGKGETRAKATVTGKRVIHTEHTAGWDAKNRHGLPPELPLSYEAYALARAAGQPANPDTLFAEAQQLLARVPEAHRAAVAEKLEAARGDAIRLAKAVDTLRSRVEGIEAAAEQQKEGA